ncbi:Conserved_hypothetical protein [Hexamita inflata]|uniref:Uncharacterized protein n=1 Tax=Hexamita inflata TaxID=28002 RepID=A0AA86Q3C8_9EUKA|nr:Conserved hypothetical protein [Hexamita inflata]
MEVYQLHYFSFSTGDNWKQIMKEQLKTQPSALTEKFRVGEINGQLCVTKALTIQSKTIDNQTTVSGFLTVVLKQPYQFPLNEPYTLFDQNMRFIAGIDDLQYQNGVKQILFRYQYIKNIYVNYTLGNILNILELNNSFWTDAFKNSNQNEYTIVITQNKLTHNNRISESDYNQSEIHQRSVIFKASCDYFVSGYIIVKQLGAIDGLLVVYQDIVLSNYNQDLQLIRTNTIDDISYYYGNLNSRTQSSTYSTNYMYFNNENSVILYKQEIIVILYQLSLPVIILLLILVRQVSVSEPKFDFYSEDQELFQEILSQNINIHNPRMITNHINFIKSLQSDIFYNIQSINTYLPLTEYIFANDLKKYQYLQNIVNHDHIYKYLQKQTEQKEQPNMFSFQILVTSQQYSVILNAILRNKSWISNQYIKFTGSLQVKYISNTILQIKYNSRLASKTSSRVMSSYDLLQDVQKQNQSIEQILEVYVSKVFDDSNLFCDRKLYTPCKVTIFKFKSPIILYNIQLSDLLEQSKLKIYSEWRD